MRKLAPARVSYRHNFLISYRVYMMTGLFHISLFEGTLHVDKMHSRPQCLRVWKCARKLCETLRRSGQNLAIWASQRMLFDQPKRFAKRFAYICFIAKCFVASVLELKKFS